MTEREFNQLFAENLNYYMLKTGTSRADLAKLLNVSVTSVANWCKGLKAPRMDKVDRMCLHFGIKRCDLLSENQSSSNGTPAIAMPPSLTASEQELLKDFRQLNEEGQELVLKAARSYVRSGDYIKTDESELVEEKEIG